ncbi:uncharacterized protein UTRI_02783_B [Ustilago trichophora]|uniref:Uncharacterized protein n=1 Tax=Ustilago trichophora TaxID=86804 RepID=A0A5C3E6B1_9BASI|nr:uncharacterized protein UTRI_02783_B [Ustilago trichophora]
MSKLLYYVLILLMTGCLSICQPMDEENFWKSVVNNLDKGKDAIELFMPKSAHPQEVPSSSYVATHGRHELSKSPAHLGLPQTSLSGPPASSSIGQLSTPPESLSVEERLSLLEHARSIFATHNHYAKVHLFTSTDPKISTGFEYEFQNSRAKFRKIMENVYFLPRPRLKSQGLNDGEGGMHIGPNPTKEVFVFKHVPDKEHESAIFQLVGMLEVPGKATAIVKHFPSYYIPKGDAKALGPDSLVVRGASLNAVRRTQWPYHI